MRICVTDGNKIADFDLAEDCPLENLVALARSEVGSESDPDEAIVLMKDGRNVLIGGRSKGIAEAGLADNDLLFYTAFQPPEGSAQVAPVASAMVAHPPTTSQGSSSLDAQRAKLASLVSSLNKNLKPKQQTEEELQEERCLKLFQGMNDPNVKRNVFSRWPKLLETYAKAPNDYNAFRAEFNAFMSEEKRKLQEINNPFSAEGQKLIEEAIRNQNIDHSYQKAIESMPEAFIPVHMLYIKAMVNGHPCIAFIDSGAQVSILSQTFAERAGLSRLTDVRYRGIVSGVGGATKFVGRIHSCELHVADSVFECKFDVLGGRDCDVLIGLDVMRRHACCIDLKQNRLVFGDGTTAEFLGEATIKEHLGERKLMAASDELVVDEEKVKKIVDMGFTKADAEDMLRETLNDMEQAVDRLFSLQAKDHEDTAKMDTN